MKKLLGLFIFFLFLYSCREEGGEIPQKDVLFQGEEGTIQEENELVTSQEELSQSNSLAGENDLALEQEPLVSQEQAPPPPPPQIPKTLNTLSFGFEGEERIVDEGSSLVKIILPFGSSLKDLVPRFNLPQVTLTSQGERLESGRSVLSFSEPQDWLLTDEVGETRSWKVEVAIREASSIASLVSIDLSGHSLNPAFRSETTGYGILLPRGLGRLEISASPTHPGAQMDLFVNADPEPRPLSPGVPLEVKDLRDGENALFIRVTAEDSRTKVFYLMDIKRQ